MERRIDLRFIELTTYDLTGPMDALTKKIRPLFVVRDTIVAILPTQYTTGIHSEIYCMGRDRTLFAIESPERIMELLKVS